MAKTYVNKVTYSNKECYGKIVIESKDKPLSVEEAVEVVEAETEASGTMIDKFEVSRKWWGG